MACVLWVLDINPYSKQLQVYNQSCEDMILDNSYCNGEWIDDPVLTYLVNADQSTITKTTNSQANGSIAYSNCAISDRKNWSCINNETNEGIFAIEGIVKNNNEVPTTIGKQTITRLKWLQNRFLEKLASN